VGALPHWLGEGEGKELVPQSTVFKLKVKLGEVRV